MQAHSFIRSHFLKHLIYDPNNNIYVLGLIESDADIRLYEGNGTHWTISTEVYAGTMDYEDFSMVLQLNGSTSYLHVVFSLGDNQYISHKRCTLTPYGTSETCGSIHYVKQSADSVDD